jgi:hypothetical protein
LQAETRYTIEGQLKRSYLAYHAAASGFAVSSHVVVEIVSHRKYGEGGRGFPSGGTATRKSLQSTSGRMAKKVHLPGLSIESTKRRESFVSAQRSLFALLVFFAFNAQRRLGPGFKSLFANRFVADIAHAKSSSFDLAQRHV